MSKLEFLKSVRFWKISIVAVLMVLQQQGVITGDLYDGIARVLELVLGGSVLIRTVDRFADKVSS